MPRFLLPKRSTPHRVAAIALFRALLSRCTSAPLPDEHREPLRNAIRQKFRRNRKMMSAYQLGLSFRAGYETLDHLDAASNGDAYSTGFLRNFTSTLSPGLTKPSVKPLPPPPHPSKKELACLPPEKAVLNVRPYKHVSGPRHVPIMSSANGIPFLRLTKPQPPALSRILRQKLDKRIERFDKKVMLQNYWMVLAEQEDKWDSLVRWEDGYEEEEGDEDDGNWMDAVKRAYMDNEQAYHKELAKDLATAVKMQKIVDEETALALEEGQEIIRGRKGRRAHRSK